VLERLALSLLPVPHGQIGLLNALLPPKQRRRPSYVLKRLMEQWCVDHGELWRYPYEYSAKIAHFDAYLPPMLCSSQQEVTMWVKTDLPVPVIRVLEGLIRMAQALMK